MPWIDIESKQYPINEIKVADFLQSPFLGAITFIHQWLANQQTFQQPTSGSTGEAKIITIHRSQMLASAKGTLAALDIQPQTTALVCINTDFIGGKMMLVRALLGQMNIVLRQPSSNPLIDNLPHIDFMALVPLQLNAIIENTTTLKKLNSISHVIVGGGAVNTELLNKLKPIKANIYATFGMTETVSHIALKRISGPLPDPYFKTLPNVAIGADKRGCLQIKAEVTNGEWLTTNDLVSIIDEHHFEWLGRFDHVINTGGLKVNSEKLEALLFPLLKARGIHNAYYVAPQNDAILGQKIVLYLEGDAFDTSTLLQHLKEKLPQYYNPKSVLFLPLFERTATGKIKRLTNK